jgi:zinc transport system substrate-binding protein
MARMLVALTSVLLVIFAAGCARTDNDSGRLRVVATLGPVGEFVRAVGGERVEVTVMVSPGASPHTYEPRPSQLVDVSRASLYAKVGSGVEFELVWMDRLLAMNAGMRVIDCSRGVEIIGRDGDADFDTGDGDHEEDGGEDAHAHGSVDPHIWLSPANAALMVENIYTALVDADPDGIDDYTKNRDSYLAGLRKLDGEIREILAAKKGRVILVYHPAWSYFAREYGLEQVAIERGGKEATPRGIGSLIKQAEREGVTVIFASPEFDPRSAEVIAREIGARVELISPLGAGYTENMLKAARAFREG